MPLVVGMSAFSDETLTDKLRDLNNSAPSIQGVSLWLLHHRKHYKDSVQVWLRELNKVGNERKLTLLYLANDVVQNARKKYPEVGKEFGTVMKEVFSNLAGLELDKKTIANIGRLVNIWRSRQIFESSVQQEICRIWDEKMGSVLAESEKRETSPPRKRVKTSEVIAPNGDVRTVSKDGSEIHKGSSDRVDIQTGSSDGIEVHKSSSDRVDIHNRNGDRVEAHNSHSDNDRLDIADCRRSLVMALQQLEEVEKAKMSVSSLTRRIDDGETGVLGDLQHNLVEELLARSRVSQLVAEVLSTQQELVARTEERLGDVREQVQRLGGGGS